LYLNENMAYRSKLATFAHLKSYTVLLKEKI